MGLVKQLGENVMPLTILYIVFKIIEPAMTTGSEGFFMNHAFVQMFHFFCIAHIPCLVTGVMWWVDLAWPLGLMVISAYNYTQVVPAKERASYKAEMITFCYFFQGFRMGMGAIYLIAIKKWRTDTEIQRYVYQKKRYEEENPGSKWTMLHTQKEIFMQAYANFAVLVIPGALICND